MINVLSVCAIRCMPSFFFSSRRRPSRWPRDWSSDVCSSALYRRGTYLFHQGDQAPDVLFLWKGRVEISSLSITGHRQLHTTLDTPQFFGELGVLGGMPRTATAMALEESTVWAVSGEVFRDFLTEHPDASRA